MIHAVFKCVKCKQPYQEFPLESIIFLPGGNKTFKCIQSESMQVKFSYDGCLMSRFEIEGNLRFSNFIAEP